MNLIKWLNNWITKIASGFIKKLKTFNKLFMKKKIKPKIMNIGVTSWKMRVFENNFVWLFPHF